MDSTDFTEADLATSSIKQIQIDALVLLKIQKHCRESTLATGRLLGIDIQSSLHITNSFPALISSPTTEDGEETTTESADYTLQMLRSLRSLNYDANTVGWYQATIFGSYWSNVLIETQFNYQRAFEQAVVIVHDESKSFPFTALRLTDEFMELYKDKKLSVADVSTCPTLRLATLMF